MSRLRYARKTDSTQADIVSGIKEAGVQCWIIHEPADLLVRFFCKNHQSHCWMVLECKPLTGKINPKPRIRTDQPEQNQFLAQTDTPIVTNATEALLILSLHGRPKIL